MSPSSFLNVPILLGLIGLVVAGCAKESPPVGGDDIELDALEEVDWPDAIRLSNGTVKVIVVPSIGGRIMRYGFVGEENVLWTMPPSEQKRAAAEGGGTPRWQNYGGDKAWPWPQDAWPLHTGRKWPPPAEVESKPLAGRLTTALSVRLESEPIAGYGAKLVREIALAGEGTRVTIVTRFEPVASEQLPPAELAAWSVTQVPTGRLYARMIEGGGVGALPPHAAWTTTRPIGPGAPRIVALEAMPQTAAKMGLDADVLASVKDTVLFVQRCASAGGGEKGGAGGNTGGRAGTYRPFERGQVFVQEKQRYAELEFTSPRVDLARGQTPELRVTWELMRHPKEWTDEAVAEVLAVK